MCSDQGFALKELRGKKKPGRNKRLTSAQLGIIYNVLEKPSEGSKNKTWTGKVLSEFIFKEFNVELQVRQCQKIIRSKKSKQ